MLGAEAIDFEFYRDQRIQAAMEKQQVQREILFADLQRKFTADKTKIAAEF